MGNARPGTLRPFIVVEGPNGAGKTTVAEGLASVLGMKAAGYPAAFLQYRRQQRLDEMADPVARLLYYLAAVAQVSGAVIAAATAVVCDRYWASPLAALEAEGALPIEVIDAIAGPVLDHIARPDLTLLLVAPPDVLATRVRDRAEPRLSASAAGVLASPVFAECWMDRLRVRSAECGPVAEIETAGLTGVGLIARAVGLVRARGLDPRASSAVLRAE